MPVFSIITPFYNAEYLLENAINSVLIQDLKDFELILIDDGSEDTSSNIAKEYAKIDSRVKYFSQENQGQGIARNFALTKATGDYVLYLDSDDWLANGALSSLYEKFKKDDSDIIFFNAYRCYESTKKKEKYFFCEPYYLKSGEEPFSPETAADYLFDGISGLPLKAYKRDFLVKNNIKYSPTRFIEDSEFYIKALVCANKISCLNKFLVNYRIHRSSTSYTKTDRIDDINYAFNVCEKIFKESKFKSSKEALNSFLRNRSSQLLWYIFSVSRADKPLYYNMMRRILRHIAKKYGLNYLDKNSDYIVVKRAIHHTYPVYEFLRKVQLTRVMLKVYIDI